MFGLLTGIIIRYSSYTGPTYEKAVLEKSENRSEDNLPDYVELVIATDREDEKNSSYLYKLVPFQYDRLLNCSNASSLTQMTDPKGGRGGLLCATLLLLSV